jgi:hypothetical protein
VVRVGLSCARHADGENGATCVGCKDGAAQRRAIACAGVSQMGGPRGGLVWNHNQAGHGGAEGCGAA